MKNKLRAYCVVVLTSTPVLVIIASITFYLFFSYSGKNGNTKLQIVIGSAIDLLVVGLTMLARWLRDRSKM